MVYQLTAKSALIDLVCLEVHDSAAVPVQRSYEEKEANDISTARVTIRGGNAKLDLVGGGHGVDAQF